MQLNIMNARVASLLAAQNEPVATSPATSCSWIWISARRTCRPGTRLAVGSAVIEVTDQPHTGCQKFVSRFGPDAMKFVNSPLGRELCLRGINAKVVRAGTIRRGRRRQEDRLTCTT